MDKQTGLDRWLGADTLETVAEVNEQALLLLRAQSLAGGPSPLLRGVNELIVTLDSASVRRAAAHTVLLVDAGFTAGGLWADAIVGAVRDRPVSAPAFFTVDGTVDVMRLVMTHAWHLARSEPTAARLLMGLSAANVAAIGGCTLRQLTRLAENHAPWLRPRWEGRPAIWRDLLHAAAAGETGALQRIRARGLQLLAAEARQG